MHTEYFFRSDDFPYIEDECINPHLYGENLAIFLTEELVKLGYEIKDYYSEDVGWEIELKNQDFPLYIRCGNLGDDDNTFGVSFEPNRPYIRRWFRKIHTEPVIAQLSQDLYKILNDHQGIYDLRFTNECLVK